MDTRTELEKFADVYSDFFKAAHGFRPRGVDTSSWTEEDFQKEFDSLHEICQDNKREEAEFAARGQAAFEKRIQDTIELGAKDREQALRWLSQEETFYDPQDVEGFVYDLGVLFTDYGQALVKELEAIVEYKEYEDA